MAQSKTRVAGLVGNTALAIITLIVLDHLHPPSPARTTITARPALVALALIIALIYADDTVMRLLRWCIRLAFGERRYRPETGAVHPVKGYDRHGPVYDMAGHDERRAKTLEVTRQRRGGFLLCLAIAEAAYYEWRVNGSTNGSMLVIWIPVLVIGGISALALPMLLVHELGYQIGFPWMEGARVVEPPPPPPTGPELITGQKGHGDAKAAGAATIAEIFNGNRSGESNIRFRK